MHHEFFPVDQPDDLSAYRRVRALRMPLKTLHTGVTCDACDEKPIVGVRHKCLVCEGESLIVSLVLVTCQC